MKKIKLITSIMGISSLSLLVTTTIVSCSCSNKKNSVTFKDKKSILKYDYSKHGNQMKGYNYTTGEWPNGYRVESATDDGMLKSVSSDLSVGAIMNSFIYSNLVSVINFLDFSNAGNYTITAGITCNTSLEGGIIFIELDMYTHIKNINPFVITTGKLDSSIKSIKPAPLYCCEYSAATESELTGNKISFGSSPNTEVPDEYFVFTDSSKEEPTSLSSESSGILHDYNNNGTVFPQ
ncbi:MAG: hypothetical protein LBV37_00895 [Mycoplasmataceae bacterium]|nr:hypothetical protein [Mycoplasmataceae bacterium]